MKQTIFILIIILTFKSNAQRFVVSNGSQQSLFAGIENPIDIIVENTSCEDLFVKTRIGKLDKNANNPCSFIFLCPHDFAGTTEFYIYKLKKKDTISIGSETFRVKHLPKPIPRVAGLKSGFISKDLLVKVKRLDASLDNLDINIVYLISHYSVKINRKEQILYVKDFYDNKLNEELITQMTSLQTGDEVIFFNISAKVLDSKEEILEQINLIIK